MAERILVTGASGFAGSHLLAHLARTVEPGTHLTAWTHRHPASSPGGAWDQVDLLDPPGVRSALERARPSVVYHLAGSPHVGSSWSDPAAPLAQNVLGTHHLFDALRLTGPCRVIVAGSAAVYAAAAAPLAERDPVKPASPYALSKFAQERLSLRAIIEDGMDVVLTRSFNHTGPRQSDAFVAPSMARQIARIEAGAAPPVLKVGNLDARRDFTDVRDVVAAYAALMATGTSGEIYNVASGAARSMGELLDALLSRARVPITVEPDTSRLRPHDTPVILGNADKLRAATGWTPQIPFEQMVDDLLEFWRAEVGGAQ